jgi:arylsulfatase A-like enzyme
LAWLKEKRDPEKPFLMMYHHKAPHRAWWPGPKHLSTFKDKAFPEPETLFDDYKNRGTAAKEQEMTLYKHMNPAGDLKLHPDSVKKYNITGTYKWGQRAYNWVYNRFREEQREMWDSAYKPRTREFFEDIPQGKKALTQWKYQAYMTDYLRCIASVDDNLGRLLDFLDESGLSENTIVVYTSDQGFYLGEHGWFDKRFMYKESFRTPLLIRWPGVIEPGSKSDKLVQNLDFAQTFLDAAGAKIPEDMQGRSMMPILKGKDTIQWRDAVYYHYYEYPAVHAVKRHYGVATDRYKLMHFYYDVNEWELYDLEKDPNEMNNVYGNPEYENVQKKMHEKLDSIQEIYGDSDSLRNVFLERYLEK